ncbi:hypothetical protein UFOVP1183_19 [uncultured Caudovirales phage]|uniref:Uncharacterized protein n=1 Tax=uncultured Caudovirales phage TaxID=2100421 RepID=A0A6J5QUH1_9CAUD|nr:hypothetical protein UFOVP955_14 [uncultured Caudovirales phage]CAB4185255.1 hypothetical protein UFOVP1120_25 [uncultured Caudovirales phage]CAB4188279.1 hypothetical protein UFOVP1183_19 [uncultured Caudovirales phage]CAB4190942.1 hypothetical protein UFOVP1227_2 [uncultured Caudovirales phage]CAB5229868.1 hypothetical protein UFOVP1571_25 [uncultured Caudovirales phage]
MAVHGSPDLLDLLASDPTPLGLERREQITAAILTVGEMHEGEINPNVVRDLLRARHGILIAPQLIGPTYRRLVTAGQIRQVGWSMSTDVEGGNAGKPCRTYRLVE